MFPCNIKPYCIHKYPWQDEHAVASSATRKCNIKIPLATTPKSNAPQEDSCDSAKLKQRNLMRLQYHFSFATPNITIEHQCGFFT